MSFGAENASFPQRDGKNKKHRWTDSFRMLPGEFSENFLVSSFFFSTFLQSRSLTVFVHVASSPVLHVSPRFGVYFEWIVSTTPRVFFVTFFSIVTCVLPRIVSGLASFVRVSMNQVVLATNECLLLQNQATTGERS